MPKSRFLWLLLSALLAAGCHRATPPPMEIGMWYWNSPFVVTDSDLKSLKTIGVKTLYVREATFTTDGKNLLTEFHEHWQSNPLGIKIVLVYNFDAGVIRHFSALSSDALVNDISAGIAHTSDLVRSHGIRAAGIQLDFDCPTRLLPKYTALLKAVRVQLTAGKTLTPSQSFSATALQTWLGSPQYDELAKATDFLAPQFYESRTGATVDSVAPIADISGLARKVDKADGFGRPFFVGLATYGHALVYDSKGRLAGMYHGMKPTEALRHPALRFHSSVPLDENGKQATEETYAGEDLVKLIAVDGDLSGQGEGDTIAYIIPSAKMLSEQLKQVKTAKAANCRGIILYRFPAAEDELALPLSTVAEVMAGRSPEPKIESLITSRLMPWALIAGEKNVRAQESYSFRLKNTGLTPTFVAKDGVAAVLRFDKPGLESVARGEFDEATAGALDPDGEFSPCALAHANAVLFIKHRLGCGQSVNSGAAEATSKGAVAQLTWRVRAQGGFRIISGHDDAVIGASGTTAPQLRDGPK